MQRIEFSEMTNRLHRNLMGSAALLIVIVFFNIKVTKASTSGLELENLTTRVILTVLIAVLVYHAAAFCIRAFEEYRIWELKLSDKQATAWGGGNFVLELADQLKSVGETLERILANSGVIQHNNQTIINADQAQELIEASKAALIYGRRLKNFPKITRFRFWFWDIGIAIAATIFSLTLAVPAICRS